MTLKQTLESYLINNGWDSKKVKSYSLVDLMEIIDSCYDKDSILFIASTQAKVSYKQALNRLDRRMK